MTDSDTTEESSERSQEEGSERTVADEDDGNGPQSERPADAPGDPGAETHDATERPRGDGAGGTAASSGRGADRMSSVRKLLYWTLLGGLVLFGGMMVLLVYSDFRTLINVFVAREYRLLIQVAFHLVVLLCAAIGVSLVVRRLEQLPG